jgi:hypothetical protein
MPNKKKWKRKRMVLLVDAMALPQNPKTPKLKPQSNKGCKKKICSFDQVSSRTHKEKSSNILQDDCDKFALRVFCNAFYNVYEPITPRD